MPASIRNNLAGLAAFALLALGANARAAFAITATHLAASTEEAPTRAPRNCSGPAMR